jgi:hypothetical protein
MATNFAAGLSWAGKIIAGGVILAAPNKPILHSLIDDMSTSVGYQVPAFVFALAGVGNSDQN